MSWIGDIAALFGTGKFKAVSEEVWKLKEEYKGRMKELEFKVEQQHKEIVSLQQGEEVCQRRYQRLEEQYRNVREELIFIKKSKQ